MNKLGRYISTTITASTLLVLFMLLGLDAIAAIVDEMGYLSGNYDFVAALRFVIYSVPATIFDLLPFAALVGCLAGLGTLASGSELVVMRSAGMLVSEYVAPVTESIAKSERAIALKKSQNIVSREGLWHREANRFLHFNAVQPNGILYGVTMYQFDEQHKPQSTLYAQRAIYQSGEWLLEDVVESIITDTRVRKVASPSKPWSTELSPELLNILMLDPIDLSIAGNDRYANYLQAQGLNSSPYRLAFWKKILQPLSTLALVLLAISFIFGPLREVTMGYRIFIGVLVGIVFRTAQDILAPASLVYGFQPIYASLIPIVICAVLGLWFLRRAR
jgi:lipopolysaccharide export system permease protein